MDDVTPVPTAERAAAPAAYEPKEKDERDLFDVLRDSTQTMADVPASADAELIFVGPKSSGKSTLVQAFLQKEEPPKPSTPLEYRYARHTVGTRPAVVANVWELGGGVSSTAHLSELIKAVMVPELLPRSVVAIVVDLSEPESALNTLVTWLDEVRCRCEEMQRELSLSAEGSALAAQARKATVKLWAEHQDMDAAAIEQVSPLAVPVVVVGHKYDAFLQACPEVEQQKVLCRTLRFFAHHAGASLIFTKHKDNLSKHLLRNLLGYHVFGNIKLELGQMQLSQMSPLFVPVGADSFKAIGNPPTVPGCLSDAMADKWRAVFEEIFPPRQAKREAQADLTMVEAEQFAEEAIDELRRQKREELVKMRKAAVFEAKMTAEMSSSTSAKPVS
jgi:dynein light intermediate chain 2